MAVPKRILLVGLFHETHTFLAEKTGLRDFTVTLGDDILGFAGNDSPIAGFLEVARERGWRVLPTIDLRAMPSGLVEESVLAYFWDEFARRATAFLADGVDAVFVVLHGAMVAEETLDVEGTFLARIRALPGAEALPLFGVLDLHANISPAMAAHADCLVAYRENPHTDAHDTACRSARLLARTLEGGLRPRTCLRQVPVVWAPPATGTADEPMRTLMRLARELEDEDPNIWAVNVAAGFSFADTLDTGVAVTASGVGKPDLLIAAAEKIAARAWDSRHQGEVEYPDVATLLPQILPITEGPVLLVEPADNIGGGAPGDGTGILRALLTHHVDDALVIINDPAAARRAHASGIGANVVLTIGGKGYSQDPGPVPLNATVVSLSDGRFELEDRQSHLASLTGRQVEMGACAVVRHRGITVLLTTKKTPPFDLGQLRSQGIEPRHLKLIGVKAAVAHQRAYNPIARASHFVDTPGPCSSRLASLPYRHLRRPIFPHDAAAGFHFPLNVP